MGRAGREPKLTEFKAFLCRLEPVLNGAASPGINKLPAATGHVGRAACGPVLPAHHPLGQLPFCRLWLPSLSPSLPAPRGSLLGWEQEPALALPGLQLSKVGAELVQQLLA